MPTQSAPQVCKPLFLFELDFLSLVTWGHCSSLLRYAKREASNGNKASQCLSPVFLVHNSHILSTCCNGSYANLTTGNLHQCLESISACSHFLGNLSRSLGGWGGLSSTPSPPPSSPLVVALKAHPHLPPLALSIPEYPHPLDFSHAFQSSGNRLCFLSTLSFFLFLLSDMPFCSVLPSSFTVVCLQEQSPQTPSERHVPDPCPSYWHLCPFHCLQESWSEAGGESSVLSWVSGPQPEPTLSLLWVQRGPSASDEATGLGGVTGPFLRFEATYRPSLSFSFHG